MTAMWEEWKDFRISSSLIQKRVQRVFASLGWQYAIQHILDEKIPLQELKVAELGCGTGTFALCFGLLGAEVTLMDNNPHALNVAKEFYDRCGITAHYIQADIFEDLPSELHEQYDLVTSGGLIEHFSGKNREVSIQQHARLLSARGKTMIAVPNRFSPFYRLVRGFRELTGTWSMDVEIPYSYWELKELAKRVGFAQVRILGNFPLASDVIEYAKGLVSAALDLLPAGVRKSVHGGKTRGQTDNPSNYPLENLSQMAMQSVEWIQQRGLSNTTGHGIRDVFGATIFLVGSKSY